MRVKRITTVLIITVLSVSVGIIFHTSVVTGESSADEIMQRVDNNEHIESARMEAKMIIEDRGREIVKEMFSYIQEEDSLTEFTNPRDRGTKYLKLDDDLWMYFPDAEDLVSISGHMLEDGMMGSDFSYEDALESRELGEQYTFELEDEASINDREVYIIKAQAKDDADASYYERRIWVDKERFVMLKEEYYSRGGRLLKVMEIEEVKEVKEGRFYPVVLVMNDKLKEDSRTTLEIEEINFDYEITKDKISLDTLQ